MDVKMKKGQTAMFIIIGLIIVGIFASVFLFKGDLDIKRSESVKKNPEIFLQSCLEKKVKETARTISSQGGYIENDLKMKFKFEEEDSYTNISYLCYVGNYYIPCVNQEPMLMQHLKDEIKNEINDDVENCFNEFVSNLEDQSYEVESEYSGFEVELDPKRIVINIDGEITTTKSGEASKQEDFNVFVMSQFYELSVVAQEIVSQEAEFCNFDVVGFMMIYPEFEVDKFRTTDLETIYTIKHKDSEDYFRFAVRGCVIPPGI